MFLFTTHRFYFKSIPTHRVVNKVHLSYFLFIFQVLIKSSWNQNFKFYGKQKVTDIVYQKSVYLKEYE